MAPSDASIELRLNPRNETGLMQIYRRLHSRSITDSSICEPLSIFREIGSVFADDYPFRPIDTVIPVTTKGSPNFGAIVIEKVGKKHIAQQPFVVINKPCASVAIGFDDVLNAKPDGCKFGLVFVELTIAPNLDTVRFLASGRRPIARLDADSTVIAIWDESPWERPKEFLPDAHKSLSSINVGNADLGSIWRLVAASIKESGMVVNPLHFLATPPAIAALLGGHIEALALSHDEASEHVASGKLRTLAALSKMRWSVCSFKRVPTFKERNIKVKTGDWNGRA